MICCSTDGSDEVLSDHLQGQPRKSDSSCADIELTLNLWLCKFDQTRWQHFWDTADPC